MHLSPVLFHGGLGVGHLDVKCFGSPENKIFISYSRPTHHIIWVTLAAPLKITLTSNIPSL